MKPKETLPPFEVQLAVVTEIIKNTTLHDLPGLSVKQHHFLALGLLSGCYPHVPPHLQMAIREAVESANDMGAGLDETFPDPNN